MARHGRSGNRQGKKKKHRRDGDQQEEGLGRRKGPRHLSPNMDRRPRRDMEEPRRREKDGTPDAILTKAMADTKAALERWVELSEKMQRQPPIKPLPGSPPTLDPWQQDAVDALVEGDNVVVDAPTTAGKTRVVETYFAQNIHDPSFRACYTTPVKSLSNDKVKELREMFGAENVGIATGDIKENLGAPIVVATLESYRNSLLGVEPDMGRSLVVFDEYHFLQDTSRGSAWEEAIILTPEHCQILMLSASAENAAEFVAWLEKIQNKPCRLVQTTHRPVPLEDIIYFREHWLLKDSLPMPMVSKNDPLLKFPLEQSEIARRARLLPELGLTPCILYCGQRRSCENMAEVMAKHLDPLPQEESQKLKERLEQDDIKVALPFMRGNLRRLIIMYGVAYHHSGMAPPARIAVEELVKAGMLRFCAATMGLSIGINFSVRSSLITDYRRPSEMGFVQYPSSEVLQMLGRAGRRGRDVVGFSLWPSLPAFRKLGNAKRERCDSRLRNDPTTFLGLLGRGFSLKNIESFYGKSFMRFRDRTIDLSVIRKERIMEKLGTKELPCASPAHEFARFLAEDKASQCYQCPYRKECHSFLENKLSGSLSLLHLHLHVIGCIDEREQLTDYGSIARYFPQAGGLLLARYIAKGIIHENNLLDAAQLMAAMALARFKEPEIPRRYELPFDVKDIEEELEELYPYELFEEMYDPPFGRRSYPQIREYNPAAGFILKEWLSGTSWEELSKKVSTEKFAQGDVMALLYRSATYLQSLKQAKLGAISTNAALLWSELMRVPLIVNESAPDAPV